MPLNQTPEKKITADDFWTCEMVSKLFDSFKNILLNLENMSEKHLSCQHCFAQGTVQIVDPVIRICANTKEEAQKALDSIPYKVCKPCTSCGGGHDPVFYGTGNETPDRNPILISLNKA